MSVRCEPRGFKSVVVERKDWFVDLIELNILYLLMFGIGLRRSQTPSPISLFCSKHSDLLRRNPDYLAGKALPKTVAYPDKEEVWKTLSDLNEGPTGF